ncbi:MAG: C40 family peptidase [Chloroflexota bacterium]|nr:C40 family peptidase [Chloroflexota bacterium]
MSSIPQRALRGPVLALVALLCLATLAPVAALANADLDIGSTAIVANANGDNVLLRDAPSFDGGVLAEMPEGTVVDVLDGPISDVDGNPWFVIAIDGPNDAPLSGFAVGYYLARHDAGSTTTPEAPTSDGATDGGSATSDVEAALAAGVGGQRPEGAAVGTAVVTGTNSDGVRCRDSAGYEGGVIAVLSEGAPLTLTGAPVGEWQPVNCGGRGGFVHSDFVGSGGSTPDTGADAGTAVGGVVSGYAAVVGTNGGRLRCRSAADYNASIITVLGEGTQVALRGGQQGEWQPVVCAGSDGFVHASFLSTSGGSSGESGADAAGDTGGDVSGSAVVSGTNGTGVRCRTAASYDASVITVLAEGTQVSLRGALQGEWQPVVCAGSNGFVYASYLSTGGGSGTTPELDASDGGAVSGYATVTGTGGGGLRCRSAADHGASVIVVLAEGSQVALRGAQQGEWQPVICAGSNGFAYASYLSTDGGSGTTPEPDPSDGGNSGGLWVGARAVTSSSLNLRYDASMSAGVAAIAPAGTVVEITSGLTNGFYGVNWDGLYGYMYGSSLSYTDAALSERGGSGDDGGASPGAGTGSGTGNAMASFALQYVGYPYVWATAGPASFDCSGFTYWVALNVLGIDIGRGLFTQVVAGTPVSYSNLQPGDLVFFQNTYTWGLSHSGIYIGNNQFVHAENETTGVKISDITSQYYSSRWYGAVRLA